MISVPSLCHWTSALSITVPSGMPGVPSDTNFTFQNPTIRSSAAACPAASESEAGVNRLVPCQTCGGIVPALCHPKRAH